jgi:uncharacterized membrane protein YgcG
LTPPTKQWHCWRVSDPSYPVTVAVKRPDGSIEHVRVGTAVRSGDGFRLSLGDLAIGGVADTASSSSPRRASAAAPPSDGGAVFPPYGRSKGSPIAGATMQDLEFYANGCRRTLNDQGKARWHDKERALLATIEAEIARQGGSVGSASSSGGYGGSGYGSGGGYGGGGGGYGRSDDFEPPPPFDDRPPPRSDDDLPF